MAPGKALQTHPTFAEATKVWATIGVLSFGGPAGQIALMHRILVEERKWISEPRFLHALNFCMLLPGPEAQQLATYVGWLLHGTRGGLVAGTLFVLPGPRGHPRPLGPLRRVPRHRLARHAVLRAQGGGARDRLRGGAPDRPARAEDAGGGGDRCRRLRRDLRPRRAVPGDRDRRRAVWIPRDAGGAGSARAGRIGCGRCRRCRSYPRRAEPRSRRSGVGAVGGAVGCAGGAARAAPRLRHGVHRHRAVLLVAGGGDLRRRLCRARLHRRCRRHHLRLAGAGGDARRPRHGRDDARPADYRPLLRRLHGRVPRGDGPRSDGGGAAGRRCLRHG